MDGPGQYVFDQITSLVTKLSVRDQVRVRARALLRSSFEQRATLPTRVDSERERQMPVDNVKRRCISTRTLAALACPFPLLCVFVGVLTVLGHQDDD